MTVKAVQTRQKTPLFQASLLPSETELARLVHARAESTPPGCGPHSPGRS